MKNKFLTHQAGFSALLISILVLMIVFIISTSIIFLVKNEQKISSNTLKSSQAYYTAEAGVEDALLRLAKKMNWSSPYPLNVGGGSATIEISDIVGGSRTITSEGTLINRTRKINIIYTISTDEISFYFGAQVGDGGMEMESNARIKGNVFSSGTVVAVTGTGFIDNDIIVAGNGNKIEDLDISGNALVHTCRYSNIGGILTYVSGGSVQNCTTGGGTQIQPNEIDKQDLPISQSQIDNWKDEASCSNNPTCIYTGDYTIDINETESFGPLKIIGNLDIGNGAILIMTGTIYVTGNITTNNGSFIELDPNSYGSLSGVVVADGQIEVENGATIQGSGLEGSYTMLLSTNSSIDKDSPAIEVRNNTTGAIFYTTQGVIRLRNNMKIREAVGYKLYLDNMAEIEYESGLENTQFTSGPGGSWKVVSWKEIE